MRRVLLVIALAVAGSQAGHLAAYAVRYGAAAVQVESTGAHAYFPLAAKTALGLAAIGLIMSLLVVAIARILARGGRRLASGPSFMTLLAVLFTIQLVLFVTQEIVEAALAGVPAHAVSAVALWGMLGQLPVAALAAITLRWLWSRVEPALAQLGWIRRVAGWSLAPVPVRILAWQPAYVAAGTRRKLGSGYTRRGPPPTFIG